jgi:HAE1 family hydrophobic/amphiphilic exporter-1
MGTTVIGGMLAASLLGVFFIPVVFYVVEKWSGAVRGTPPAMASEPRISPAPGD